MKNDVIENPEEPQEAFGELIKFTASGFAGGVIVGILLDFFGFERSSVGQWIVRTLAGEGESILEGFYAVKHRLMGKTASMAEAYGWGKLLGMIVPWLVDWGSRLFGVDVYSPGSFYIPYFYALSDQIGANVSGYLYLRKREGSHLEATRTYLHHPVMRASLVVVLGVPLGLLSVRVLGFRPTTQVLTAMETIAANLCWVPPLVGWIYERKGKV